MEKEVAKVRLINHFSGFKIQSECCLESKDKTLARETQKKGTLKQGSRKGSKVLFKARN